MTAQAECAFALGRLDGLLAGLGDSEKRLFCWALLRETLLSALRQAGFADTELQFNGWFVGTSRAPQEGALTSCSPRAIVQAILAELAHHTWEPLAEAARRVQAMGRFVAEREDSQDDEFAHHALQRASVLVGQAAGGKGSPLPFPALVRLTAMARQDPHFAPLERATRMFSIGDRDIAYEQAGPRTPLWAIDIKLGSLFATCGTWRIPLPCPGAMTAQVLAAQLLDGERRLVLSGSNAAMAHRLTHCGETARQRAVTMNAAFGHLRSNARAPLVWMAAIGFAPLGLDQVTSGFGVSRRGTYTVSDALIAAGLVTRNSIKGMVVLTGQEPGMAKPFPSAPQSALAPSPAIAEFDAAMADIDRLLARSSSNYV